MADNSKIEWTDATWNPVTGCTKVSPGCDHCYIERTPAFFFNGRRFDRPGTGATTGVQLHPERLDQPLRWTRPRRIFVNSLADLFHDEVPEEYIARVFAVMSAGHHTYQLLTKRHGRMRALLSSEDFQRAVYEARNCPQWTMPDSTWHGWPLPNVWLGVSVEDQERAELRIPALLRTPAAVRFLSCEPLLGPVDLGGLLSYCPEHDFSGGFCVQRHHPGVQHIDWVIVGGESGPGARPMHPAWARSLRDHCTQAGVAFHFKQHGEWQPIGPLYGEGDEVEDAHMEALYLEVNERRPVIQLEPDGTVVNPEEYQPGSGTWLMARVGKKAAGRHLDGRTWDEYPAVSP